MTIRLKSPGIIDQNKANGKQHDRGKRLSWRVGKISEIDYASYSKIQRSELISGDIFVQWVVERIVTGWNVIMRL